MKKILMILALLSLLTTSLFAQQKQKMAVVSFTGRELSEDERSVLLDLFAGELTKSEYRNDFTLLARNERALSTAFGELNFQRDSMLNQNQMGEIGKQLGAGWVFYGTVSSFGGTVVTINILDVETSQIIATANRKFSNIYQVAEGNAALNMTKELIAKARGTKFVATDTSELSLEQQLNSVTMVRNIGRGLWIGGTPVLLVGAIMAIANNSSAGEYGLSGMLYAIGITGVVIGGIAVASGVPVDIIYSIKKKNLESQLNYSFLPYIVPDTGLDGQFNGNLDMGVQLAFSYKF